MNEGREHIDRLIERAENDCWAMRQAMRSGSRSGLLRAADQLEQTGRDIAICARAELDADCQPRADLRCVTCNAPIMYGTQCRTCRALHEPEPLTMHREITTSAMLAGTPYAAPTPFSVTASVLAKLGAPYG